MSKDVNMPGAGDKPTDRDVSDFLPDDAADLVVEEWHEVGRKAAQHEKEDRPRRDQMNVDVAADVLDRFRDRIKDDTDLQMRFVVEDLIRLYLERTDS